MTLTIRGTKRELCGLGGAGRHKPQDGHELKVKQEERPGRGPDTQACPRRALLASEVPTRRGSPAAGPTGRPGHSRGHCPPAFLRPPHPALRHTDAPCPGGVTQAHLQAPLGGPGRSQRSDPRRFCQVGTRPSAALSCLFLLGKGTLVFLPPLQKPPMCLLSDGGLGPGGVAG